MSEGGSSEFLPGRDETSSRSRSTTISELSEQAKDSYMLIPYGFQQKASYKPKGKSKDITGVTYNSRSRQFIILDSKGITAWAHNSVINAVSRLLDYPSYQFNLIRLLLHSKKFNVYFGVSKDYALKVFNLNFHEVFSVVSDMNSVLCMVFNSVTDELITGGTGGIRFWSFGEIQSNESSLTRDSRPMANYGLILRREHSARSGMMVKDIVLDERNQRLYCLSERNVLAYDMKGNSLFELQSAHEGQVTGCVYSKYSNFVVTTGTDCAVNVWSSNGGCLHSFHSHSKMVTNLLLHPEAPSLVITSSQDGTVKIFSLDIMEEIYSQVVFPESIEWMNFIAQDVLYCTSSKALQVFSINHVTNFWTTVRCPLRSISLTAGSHGSRQKVLAIGEDYSARFLSKDGHLLSTVLPPPPVTTGQQSQRCSAHAYCPVYGLMYLLVNEQEIWVYYTKSNPANRVEVWKLEDIQDIANNRENNSRSANKSCTPVSERPRTVTPLERLPSSMRSSPSPFHPPAKIVDGVPCLSLAFLNSAVNLKNKAGESYSELTYFLVLGLQDGRLLFASAFSALVLYFQFQATKGAVLSIQHDIINNLLILNTITLNKYTVQIRGLPDLDIKHQIDAGNDLTCFVRMGCSFLTGHESGRLNLYRLISEQVACDVDDRATFDGQKISKDHLDTVLTVDASDSLQLFCSSSKDGCIKIWNNTKVLLREIIMDKTLTSVCFLNSSGDLLAGFKNHIFSISREKAHLTTYLNKGSSRRNSDLYETGSDIYEDPRVRFEYKKIIPSDPVRMETYLVPHSNISINLARFLSGQLPPNSLENDRESENDGMESEFSDAFSVAPTDIYMSQSGTPCSRSRSSSIVSSWNLPNIGSSPVSSPPRTPPPFMSPVFELESEDELSTQENEISEDNEVKNFTRGNELGGKETSKKTVKVIPLFSRQKRLGLSERKINSRAVQSKDSVDTAKNGDRLRSKRENHEDATNSSTPSQQVSHLTTSSRPVRIVVKKTKKKARKSQAKFRNVQQPSSGNNVENINRVQNDFLQKGAEESTINTREEKVTLKLIEEKQLDEISLENVKINNIENEKPSQTFYGDVMMKTNNPLNEPVYHAKETVEFLSEKDDLRETLVEEAFAVKKENEQFVEDELPITIRYGSPTCFQQDVNNENWSAGHPRNEKRHLETKANDLLPTIVLSREESLNSNIDLQEQLEQLQFPSSNTDPHDEMECSNRTVEVRIDVKQQESIASSSDCEQSSNEDYSEEKSEKANNLVTKSVSFVVTENPKEIKPREKIPPRLSPRQGRPGRRSVSPVSFTPKVVPVLDSPSNDHTHEQRLHPNSALKIYALAKNRRRSSSSQSLVSRPRVKQSSFVRHNTSEIAFGGETRNGFIDGEIDRVPRSGGVIQDDERIPVSMRDNEGHGRKETKDLMSWCISALSEKSKYPMFSPKPRLRSRRSLLKEEDKLSNSFIVNNYDSNDRQNDVTRDFPHDDVVNRRKHGRQDVVENGNNLEKREKYGHIKPMLHTKVSRHVTETNVADYTEGWQERVLEKAKEMKEKQLERKRKVLEKQMVDKRTLEDKRCVLELHGTRGIHRSNRDKTHIDGSGSCWIKMGNGYESPGIHDDMRNKTQGISVDKEESQRIIVGGLGNRRTKAGSDYGCSGIITDKELATQYINKDHNGRAHQMNTDERHESNGINMNKRDGINLDQEGYHDMQSDKKNLYRVRSSYENFKNNPVIIQPYRLEKFVSKKDEICLHGLNVDPNSSELPDHLLELIPRPKSAPSIPSKCRKYVLVASESESARDKPAPTVLEEMLMLQRFPGSRLSILRSRSCSPQLSQIRRPNSLQKIPTVNMSCK